MNILPKKRWHVRTKDNIARVRRDQAAAKAEEDKKEKQLKQAESEVRLNFLRKQSNIEVENTQDTVNKTNSKGVESKHVDLFSDFESHIKTTNKDHEIEKKEETEKYEKQIGYLTYLGQDTNEALKLRSWYEVAPKRRKSYDGDADVIDEKDLKSKQIHDPLTLIKSLLPPEEKPKEKKPFVESAISHTEHVKLKKHKKEKKHKHDKMKRDKKKKKSKKKSKNSSDSEDVIHKKKKEDMLKELRQERLCREAAEKARQEALLKPKTAAESGEEEPNTVIRPRVKQKYNSQFNPEIAKQNM